MDKLDRKLIEELDMRPDASISSVAKKLRVSPQVADYRLKRLIEQKVVLKFGTIVNLKALGLEQYRIFFTLGAKKNFSNEDVFGYLKKRKGVYWACRVGGKYDLHVVLFAKDYTEFDNFMDDINKQFPGLIQDTKACYGLEHRIYHHKYMGGGDSCFSYSSSDALVDVDAIDLDILRMLKDDCRLSSLDIAKGKDYSYRTVMNRVKALEEKKVILWYRLYLKSVDEKPYMLLFSFKNYSRKDETALLGHIGALPASTQLVRMFGLWNVFVSVRAKSMEEVQQMVIDLRGKFDIIDDYEVIPVFEDISINLMPM